MDKMLLGRYINGDSLIHRMDPRAKLFLSFYFIVIVFLCNNWQTYVLMAALVLLFIKLSDISLGFFIKGVRPLIWLILFTVLLQIFFSSGGNVYWQWGPFTVTDRG